MSAEKIRETAEPSVYTPESVREAFQLDYETDYNLVSKEPFVRVKWREKGKRGRWSKVAVFLSDVHPNIGDLINNRAEYVAAWLNMQAERRALDTSGSAASQEVAP